MESSSTLINAHIEFLDIQLALIHIPLELYDFFVRPILQLLLPTEVSDLVATAANEQFSRRINSGLSDHPFTNISITPIECSIACSRDHANRLFIPAQQELPVDLRDAVSVTVDDYVVMQIDGEGLDAGQRVLELTSPLAMAGISIFFVTTYFSDYILVPLHAKQTVISALEARGFAVDLPDSCGSSNAYTHRARSSSSSFDTFNFKFPPTTPSTPPPATVGELQMRTFATLKKRNVIPSIDPSLRLLQCAARKPSTGSSISAAALGDRLQLSLIQCLLAKPRFLSLTLTDTEPASLLLEQRLLPFFDLLPRHNPNSHHDPAPSAAAGAAAGAAPTPPDSLLLGSKTTVLHPIILDLRTLPLESTGIVCGVAGRLVGGTKMGLLEAVDMSYLSTARAGAVMVAEEDADRAVMALQGWDTEAVAESEGVGGI